MQVQTSCLFWCPVQ